VPTNDPPNLDVLIIGGGIAGLWLLDELRRAGYRAALLERSSLGHGQTLQSQGIIHGGLKYTLAGLLNPSAEAIREMPAVWRDCLSGRREPDLSGCPVRAEFCHLWRTDTLASRAGMIGAKLGLRVAPVTVQAPDRPPVLRDCPGTVARLDEQVIDVRSVVERLAERNKGAVLSTAGCSLELEWSGGGVLATVTSSAGSGSLRLTAGRVVLTAGAGNAELRDRLGLAPGRTQVRPLHQAMARGPLPELNGHCVDGARTRVTITSARDNLGRTVWQVGGQIAEDGVALDGARLVALAKSEVCACLPSLSLEGVEWATYRADRAEMVPASGTPRRPDDVCILTEGPIITAWPTKLALAPRLAARVLTELGTAARSDEPGGVVIDWPAPEVGIEPWNAPRDWTP